jgi:hypothetical protein
MKSFIDHIFPTKIFIFDFNQDEINNIIKDFILEEDNMININNHNTNNGSCGNYFTDFYSPCKNKSYENLINNVKDYFDNQRLSFKIIKYWSAVYINNAMHSAHVHSSKMRPNFDDCNYASVLCLSNLGETRFLSSNNCSDSVDYIYPSKIGRMLIFPSNLFHDALCKDKGMRRIISSNLSISNVC